jgi:hypothetical protein
MQRAGTWMWDDFYESPGDADAGAGDEIPDTEGASRVMVAPPLQAASHLHEDLDTLLALFDVEEPDEANEADARSRVKVAPPVKANAQRHEDLGALTVLVDDEEPDGVTAIDATPDVMVAPPVRAKGRRHEDLSAVTAFVDDEEPDGAAAHDATPDVMVAPPVRARARRHEDLGAVTAFVEDVEPDGATVIDSTPDVMVTPPVKSEAHHHEDHGVLTPLADVEEPDGARANDALRFTLPMGGGSTEQTMLVLVPRKTGLVYGHQYGGLKCRYAETEGFLVPAWVNPEARAGLDRLFLADLGGNGVRDEDRPEAVERVRDAIQQIWYRGTGDRMAPLQVDDARSAELDEAWVPVLTPDGPAYLAWSNSD